MVWFKTRNPGKNIDPAVDYYKQGYIDSFGIVELISEIEDLLNVQLDDEVLTHKDFRRITGLASLLSSRYEWPNPQ